MKRSPCGTCAYACVSGTPAALPSSVISRSPALQRVATRPAVTSPPLAGGAPYAASFPQSSPAPLLHADQRRKPAGDPSVRHAGRHRRRGQRWPTAGWAGCRASARMPAALACAARAARACGSPWRAVPGALPPKHDASRSAVAPRRCARRRQQGHGGSFARASAGRHSGGRGRRRAVPHGRDPDQGAGISPAPLLLQVISITTNG